MVTIRLFQLFRISLKRYLNIKRTVLIQFTCIVLIAILSTVFANFTEDYNSAQKIKLGIIVNDSHQYINMLLTNFTENKEFTALFDIAIDDDQIIKKAFDKGTLDAYVVIPPSFTSNMLSYRSNNIKIYTHFGFPTKTKILKSVFSAYSRYVQTSNAATLTFYDLLVKAKLDKSTIEKANNYFSIEIISVALGRNAMFSVKPLDALAGVSATAYFIIALSFALLGFAMIPVVDATYQDMQQQVAARLISTGISTSAYLANLHAIQTLSTLIQAAFIAIVWSFYSGSNPLLTVFSFTAMTLFWSILWLSLAMLLKNRQLYFVSSSIIAFMLALLGGSITPFTIMPLQLKLLSGYSPILSFTKFALAIGQSYYRMLLWLVLAAALVAYQYYIIKTRKYGEIS